MAVRHQDRAMLLKCVNVENWHPHLESLTFRQNFPGASLFFWRWSWKTDLLFWNILWLPKHWSLKKKNKKKKDKHNYTFTKILQNVLSHASFDDFIAAFFLKLSLVKFGHGKFWARACIAFIHVHTHIYTLHIYICVLC